MTWREDLRRVTLPDGRRLVGASFRGVPFLVDVAERAGGRRLVTHEPPLRDDPYIEDLGRKARTFKVDGHVIGDDYIAQRDALLAALEDVAGPGQLVHPYYGTKRCACGGVTVRESAAEGGMAVLSIDFAHAPAQSLAPTIEVDHPGQVEASAAAAVTASSTEFDVGFDVGGLVAFALASAATALKSMTAKLNATLAPAIHSAQELAAFAGQIHLLTAEASALVARPAEILGAFRSAFIGLVDTVAEAPLAVVNALLDTYLADLGPDAPETTTTRQRERANQRAISAALRQAVVIEAARIAPTVAYESIEQASTVRGTIIARIDELAGAAGDTVYPALVQLRADVSAAIPGDAVFARVTIVSRRSAVPSILLAFQLYGSVDKELDLVARNAIANPTFIFGDVRALSNA